MTISINVGALETEIELQMVGAPILLGVLRGGASLKTANVLPLIPLGVMSAVVSNNTAGTARSGSVYYWTLADEALYTWEIEDEIPNS